MNPILFPNNFADNRSRLPIGRFGDEAATTAWVKQIIVEMFYGRSVPLFSFHDNTISWEDGASYFDGTAHLVQRGSYSFEPLNVGWYYVYSQQGVVGTSEVVVSGSHPTLASQQLWWHLKVEDGLILEVIPSKPGFGV